MAELDVEALKRLVHVAEGDCPTPPGERKDCPRCQAVDQLAAIVAAFNASVVAGHAPCRPGGPR